MRFVETRRRPIVTHDAVLAEHHAVAATSDGQRIPSVDVDAIQEFGDVATLQLDLAERRDVDRPDMLADVARLAVCGVILGFARTWIRMGTLPQTGVHKPRAVLCVPSVHRRV